MTTQADHDRLTLQEYLQTYNIRKKIEQRKRSKSRSKSPMIVTEQQHRVSNIFSTMDQFLQQTKIQLEDILLNTQVKRDKIFFFISKQLDELVLKLKDEISKMYKDVYKHYLIQGKEGQLNINQETETYFKDKMKNAIEEKKKSNLGQVIKQNFKKEDKNAFIAKLIIGDTIKKEGPFFMDNKSGVDQKQLRIKNEKQEKKQVPAKKQGKKQINEVKKNNQLQVPSQKLTIPANQIKQSSSDSKKAIQQPQPRGNSFFEALFGAMQQQKFNDPVVAPQIQSKLESKPSNAKQGPLPSQKGSKLSRPFERKTSMKEVLSSPKGRRAFKGTSPGI